MTAAPRCYPTHRQCPSGRAGFTLIELVAVISILGIIGAAVAGPTLSVLGDVRTRGAAARIRSDVAYAQRWALSTRRRTWVLFNVEANSYELFAENPANPGKAARVGLPHPLDGGSGPRPIGDPPFNGATLVSVTIGPTAELEFDSRGRPFDGNGDPLTAVAEIRLTGAGVDVHPLTGMCEVTP